MSKNPQIELRLPDYLVRNRNFVLLWLAYGIAAIGDHLSEMALLQERGGLARPDATRVQALISFGFFLPFVLLGPIAGWWSDRFSRKTTMILADILRGAVVFNLAWIVMTLERWLEPERFVAGQPSGAPLAGWGDFAIVIPLALVGAMAAFFSPARQSLLPTLIRDTQLVRANALINALGTIGGITGGVLGGKLVDYFGPDNLHHNYHLNALTFLLSAAFVSGIAMRQTRAAPRPPLEGVLAPIVQGFRYVRQHARIFQLIGLGSVFWGAAGIVISVVPAVVRDVFGGSIGDVAIFRGLIVVGLATGAGVMSVIGPALPLQLGIGLGLFGGGFWVLALNLAYVFFAGGVSEPGGESRAGSLGSIITGVCLFGIGGAGAAILVSMMATIQRLVPDSRRGRVFGVSDTATMGAMVLTSGVLGLAPIPNLDSMIPWLLLITGGMLWTALFVALRIYHRPDYAGLMTHFVMKLVDFHARFWCRMRRDGRCTLPRRGPVVLAANHVSGVDPLLVLAASPNRTVSFLIERRFHEHPIAGWFLRLVGSIPFDPSRPARSLADCLRRLRAGGAVGIFPAGRYAAPGESAPEARSGIGVLALRSGATVIPCHISGVQYLASPLGGCLVRHNARVRFGPPVDLSSFRGRERDRAAQDEATALIMRRIAELAPVEEAAVRPPAT